MKKMTKREKYALFTKITDLGCIVCGSPAEIHHICTYMGGGRDDSRVIGLCPGHHRNGGYGVAIHAGKKAFERKHGTEQELFDKTMELINETY